MVTEKKVLNTDVNSKASSANSTASRWCLSMNLNNNAFDHFYFVPEPNHHEETK